MSGWLAGLLVVAGAGRPSRIGGPGPLDAAGRSTSPRSSTASPRRPGRRLDPLTVSVDLPTRRPVAAADAPLPDGRAHSPTSRSSCADAAVGFTIGPDPSNAPGSRAWAQRLDGLAGEDPRRGRPAVAVRVPGSPVVPAQRSGPADDLPAPRPELVLGRLQAPRPRPRSGRVWRRHLRLPVQPRHERDLGRVRPRPRGVPPARKETQPLGRSWRTRWGRSWPGGTSSPAGRRAGDIAALLLIAPPNHGSSLAHGQTLMQTVQTLQSVRGERRTDPLAYLGDGLGAAADDLSPGSAYPDRLNARPRRAGVAYRILAGDSAYLSSRRAGRWRRSSRRRGRSAGSGGCWPRG